LYAHFEQKGAAMNGRTLGLLVVGMMTISLSAHAQFVTTSAWTAGDGLITEDTATGLEWMNLVVTQNTSVNALLAGYGGLEADGFHVATTAQVNTLFSDAGLTFSVNATITPSAANVAPGNLFISSLGCTFCALSRTSNYDTTEALFQSPGEIGQAVVGVEATNGSIPDPPANPAALGYAGYSTSINQLHYNAYSSPQDGIFLVREIPATNALLPGVDPNPAPPELLNGGVPEIDLTSAASGLTLLLGGLVVLRGRRERNAV
jgi:hypothetical protein